MKRNVFLIAMMFAISSLFGIYTVGQTAVSTDNISWTVQGPAWHPDMGTTDKLFDMISKGKPVMIFFGGTG